jgi:DNA-binding winged helix-turn-helix (wHTH) protein
MKIVVNTKDTELYNMFYKAGKEDHQVVNAKVENVLFDIIEKNNVDAYVLSNDTPYFKKAVDFIKKKDPYTPIIGMIYENPIITASVDIYMTVLSTIIGHSYESFVNHVLYNINTYIKTFSTLKKLTTKLHDVIEFANCKYDPSRRILYHRVKLVQTDKDKEPEFTYKEIKKFSKKEGDILEILAINYGEVVKKEIILEKVWRKPNDYFAGRSMDVYISYLRKTFKTNKIKLTIKNISGIGLILE